MGKEAAVRSDCPVQRGDFTPTEISVSRKRPLGSHPNSSGCDFLISGFERDVSAGIQRAIRKAVCFAILLAWDVLDRKMFKHTDHFESTLVKGSEVAAFDFVGTKNLPDEQFGIALHTDAALLAADTILQRREQRLILSEVVGGSAQILCE
jgi:hypothetical protein